MDYCHAELPNIAIIQSYGEDNTPFDDFDNECHEKSGVADAKLDMSDEAIMFMVNTAEQVQRPEDMLMFLGEYFKMLIKRTNDISKNISNERGEVGKNHQTDYFLTYEVLSSLGTACKMYIDPPRQELRIAIALARNPLFEDDSP